jgi:hypothetical protein
VGFETHEYRPDRGSLVLRWQATIGASKPEAERERANQEAVSAHGDIRPLEEIYVRSALTLLS